MDYKCQVDPFMVQSRLVGPEELSEIASIGDRGCLVVNKLPNYESLGAIHR